MVPGDAWRPSSSGTDPVNSLTDKSKDKNLTEKHKQTNTNQKTQTQKSIAPDSFSRAGDRFLFDTEGKEKKCLLCCKALQGRAGSWDF